MLRYLYVIFDMGLSGRGEGRDTVLFFVGASQFGGGPVEMVFTEFDEVVGCKVEFFGNLFQG